MNMRIHILQHVAFEGPAAIADWASFHGHSITSTRYFTKDWKHPSLNDFDMLVIMGGPMGVHDTAEYTWMQPEMDFVLQALNAGKKILGVCLGAQVIAHVLGGKITMNHAREIGWFGLEAFSDLLPKEFVAFHWHGETFSLPEGAQLLCSSKACVNQGFLWRNQALALQFHLETTEASAEALLANAASDLQKCGDWVQNPEQIRQGSKEYCIRLNRLLFQLLDRWSALS